jgi:exopolyphosphatase/guanosine-5'-triphosphate,3'-diphosphate pyrophosphatase
MTSLADRYAKINGDAPQDSLYVLRRGRLKSLFDLLRSQHLQERKAALVGDPNRADILVAGASVLLSMMTLLDLDYLFVSRRGLRDGLMTDLLKGNYPAYTGAWTEEDARSETLEEVGEKYNYDKTHCQHVARLAELLFLQLQELHGLPERYSRILHAAAMLHDIGLFIAYPKHHKHSYYLIKSSGPSTFDPIDLDLIANIARYHRKGHPSPKHLPFSQLSALQQDVVRKLAAMLRIADALDYGHQSKVNSVECKISNSKRKQLSIRLEGAGAFEDEIRCATEKSTLMNEVYGVETVFK